MASNNSSEDELPKKWKYIFRFVGFGAQAIALRMMLQPKEQIQQMLKPEAFQKIQQNSMGNKILMLMTRWCGFFFFSFAGATAWLSFQPLTKQTKSLMRLFGFLWLIDAIFVKFLHFRGSNLLNFADAAGAGIFDFSMGVINLYLSNK